jgi:hypothetical protein
MNAPKVHRKQAVNLACSDRDQADSVDPKAVLQMLFNLLEEYGPTWYTTKHHDDILAAIQALDRASSSAFKRPTKSR